MARFDLMVAARSVSAKPEGEDRYNVFGEGADTAGVVVCDGVGSVPGSGDVAEQASELGRALLGEQEFGSAIWRLDDDMGRCLPRDSEGATTMVVVGADREGVVGHMLLGNGAVLEVLPMEVEPGKVRLLWTSIALPQMAGEGGRPALRSFLPAEACPVEAEKGLRKASAGIPRLYIACTDGFLSEEERREGPAPDGTVWRQVPNPVVHLMTLLKSAWPDLLKPESDQTASLLSESIEHCLADMSDEKPVLDDTTVGVLFLRPVREAPDAGGGQ